MEIKKYLNRMAGENTYILTEQEHSETAKIQQLIIDPGSDPEDYLYDLKNPLAILLTHAHFDHIMGIPQVLEKFPNLPIYLHEAEKDWTHHPEYNGSRLMMGQDLIVPDADHFYQFDQMTELGLFSFEVRETPGHSIGGVSFVFDKEQLVFSGDALFAGSIGRTDLYSGNHQQLLDSIQSQLFSLSDRYRVLSGHGNETTIGTEKRANPFFR